MSDCAGKYAYPTRQEARKRLRGHRRRGPKYENRPLEPYRCDECGQWHLGHRTARPK